MATSIAADDLFATAFTLETPVGRCVGVRLAAALAADADALVACLHPAERLLCRDMRRARLVEFAGGRIAARIADAGRADIPTLRAPDGAPCRAGAAISISHTRDLAAALLGASAGRHIGLDIERLDHAPGEDLLAERILSTEERRADAEGGALPVLLRLSLKEAAFKALSPLLGPVRLRRILVLARPDGAPVLRVARADVRLTAVVRRFEDHVVGIVAVDPAGDSSRT